MKPTTVRGCSRLTLESLENRELLSATTLSMSPSVGSTSSLLAPALLATSGNPDSSGVTKGPGYEYYRYGNQLPAAATLTPTPGLALDGGGGDIDALFAWMGAKANGGDFLVLGATGNGYYDPYIYKLNRAHPLNSVATLLITSLDASSGRSQDFIVDTISKANAIFIEGGDQSTYWRLWQGPIQTAINDAVNARHVPIGGTSAGLAVLGQYIFSAENGTAYSNTVLANPYDASVTLRKDFLDVPLLQNTITDTHFYERDRMGRLVTFMDRLVTDYNTPATGTKGIGVDADTALLVDLAGGPTSPAYGNTLVVGNSSKDPVARHAYFLETDHFKMYTSSSTTSFATNPIHVHKAGIGDTFNLNTLWTAMIGRSSFDASDYTVIAFWATLESTQKPNKAIY